MRRSAGVRIGFGRRQHCYCAFVFGYAVQRAVPETKVALPAFKVALRLGDYGKLFSTFALERRHNGFILAFACGCALSSVYGFLAGTWPFGVVEAIWTMVALHRYRARR